MKEDQMKTATLRLSKEGNFVREITIMGLTAVYLAAVYYLIKQVIHLYQQNEEVSFSKHKRK